MLTSSAAKKKVKAHVKRYRNNDGFQFTDRHIIYWFGIINRAAFRNRLPVPDFKIRRLRGAWGLCEGDNGNEIVISINETIDNRELFIATLAHEMVHQYQYLYLGGTMNHKESFIEWKRFFKRHMKILI